MTRVECERSTRFAESALNAAATGRERPSLRFVSVDEITDDERRTVLAGLFEMCITYADDPERVAEIKALAIKLGGDPDAVFFNPAA